MPFVLNHSNCSSAHFLPAASWTRRWACMMPFIVNTTCSSLFIMLEDRIRYGNSGSAGLRRCGSLRERPSPAPRPVGATIETHRANGAQVATTRHEGSEWHDRSWRPTLWQH